MRTIEECRSAPALAERLWTERQLAERLLYKLVVARLVSATDDHDHIARALREVGELRARLHAAAADRRAALADLAADWGAAPAAVTLSALTEQCPEPWATMFGEHHEALAALRTRIESTGSGTVGDVLAPGTADDADTAEASAELSLRELGLQTTREALASVLSPSLLRLLS